jgi:hypothetical protein
MKRAGTKLKPELGELELELEELELELELEELELEELKPELEEPELDEAPLELEKLEATEPIAPAASRNSCSPAASPSPRCPLFSALALFFAESGVDNNPKPNTTHIEKRIFIYHSIAINLFDGMMAMPTTQMAYESTPNFLFFWQKRMMFA